MDSYKNTTKQREHMVILLVENSELQIKKKNEEF